jgi:5-methylcytosine-specific restriction endonuclease McrA
MYDVWVPRCKKTCSSCGVEFIATTGRKLRCEDCSRCAECGEKVKRSSYRFCSLSCSSKWTYRNRIDIQEQMASFRERGRTPEARKKASISNTGTVRTSIRGENHWAWKGGEKYGRQSGRSEYRNWRRQVLSRDGHRCSECGDTRLLTAHHVIGIDTRPDLIHEVSNGITLCGSCHTRRHWREGTYANRSTHGKYERDPK